jgi:hypothetical protein
MAYDAATGQLVLFGGLIGSSLDDTWIYAATQSPHITSPSATTFSVGAAGRFTVTTSGFPPAGLSQMGALPGGVSFMDNLDGTATLSGTPQTGTAGTYPLTITASNGIGPPASQTLTLTVTVPLTHHVDLPFVPMR